MKSWKVIASKSNGEKISFEVKAYSRDEAREKAFEGCYRLGVCFEEMF